MAGMEYGDERGYDSNAVVRLAPGPGTGDVVLVTARGEGWLVVPDFPAERGTAERRGLYDGRRVNEI